MSILAASLHNFDPIHAR